ncbi:MAG: UDP-N-acetylmuramoyl-tripeptide--D-alanyl-D-alanine ligase [Pseudomonadota bacterium]
MSFLLLVSSAIFTAKRLITFLHVFQQEEYNSKRFIPWLIENKAFDKRLSVIVIALIVLSFALPSGIIALTLSIGFLTIAYLEKNPLKDAKKKLVLTNRAKRILGTSLAIMVFATVIILGLPGTHLLLWLIYIQLIPLSLVGATYLLKPVEDSVNNKFRQEAVDKLEELSPYVIAITGSFGKTSVKHILGHILENSSPTLITPGSVNTEMGIVRIIREKLTKNHKYFIVEMGAYGLGSIARLCKLTPPHLSMVTAIGKAHFERFKDLEVTAQTKYEIAEAAIANNGKVIINTKVLQRKYAKEFTEENNDHFIHCGEGGTIRAEHIIQKPEGLNFDLVINNETRNVLIPIYGQHHVENTLLAVAAALELGMDIEDILVSLKTIPQITHRLEVKPQPNYTIIDDAFNSNPGGFEAALEVLDQITDKASKRILVTPGMVELGDDHDSEHLRLGKIAAQKTDVTIAVCPERIESFIDGFEEANDNKSEILKMESFKEAQNWITQNAKKGDVILLENDLPDLYEDKIKI